MHHHHQHRLQQWTFNKTILTLKPSVMTLVAPFMFILLFCLAAVPWLLLYWPWAFANLETKPPAGLNWMVSYINRARPQDTLACSVTLYSHMCAAVNLVNSFQSSWDTYRTASLWAYQSGNSSGLFERQDFYETSKNLRALGVVYEQIGYCIRLAHQDREAYEEKARQYYANVFPVQFLDGSGVVLTAVRETFLMINALCYSFHLCLTLLLKPIQYK